MVPVVPIPSPLFLRVFSLEINSGVVSYQHREASIFGGVFEFQLSYFLPNEKQVQIVRIIDLTYCIECLLKQILFLNLHTDQQVAQISLIGLGLLQQRNIVPD